VPVAPHAEQADCVPQGQSAQDWSGALRVLGGELQQQPPGK